MLRSDNFRRSIVLRQKAPTGRPRCYDSQPAESASSSTTAAEHTEPRAAATSKNGGQREVLLRKRFVWDLFFLNHSLVTHQKKPTCFCWGCSWHLGCVHCWLSSFIPLLATNDVHSPRQLVLVWTEVVCKMPKHTHTHEKTHAQCHWFIYLFLKGTLVQSPSLERSQCELCTLCENTIILFLAGVDQLSRCKKCMKRVWNVFPVSECFTTGGWRGESQIFRTEVVWVSGCSPGWRKRSVMHCG